MRHNRQLGVFSDFESQEGVWIEAFNTVGDFYSDVTDNPMPDDAHRLHLGDELWQLLEVEHGVCLTYIIVHSVVVVMVIQIWTSQPSTETE